MPKKSRLIRIYEKSFPKDEVFHDDPRRPAIENEMRQVIKAATPVDAAKFIELCKRGGTTAASVARAATRRVEERRC